MATSATFIGLVPLEQLADRLRTTGIRFHGRDVSRRFRNRIPQHVFQQPKAPY